MERSAPARPAARSLAHSLTSDGDSAEPRQSRAGAPVRRLIPLVLALCASRGVAAAQKLEQVADKLATPVFVTSWPGNTDVLLIVERQSAKIIKMLVYTPGGGGLPGVPAQQDFLDLSSKAHVPTLPCCDFGGVTGFVFHPEFGTDRTKRYVYVRYNALEESDLGAGDRKRMILERYEVPIGWGIADPNSGVEFYHQDMDDGTITTHLSGQIHFDTIAGSTRLYAAMGDDDKGPPFNCNPLEMLRAQDDASDLGKLLAFDGIDAIVQGNPPIVPTKLAKGLRNPFGFSVDRANGDVWLGNTGPDCSGDVFWWLPGTPPGTNYGWPCYIGDCIPVGQPPVFRDANCIADPVCAALDVNSLTLPLYVVPNALTGGFHDALLGGYLYRGSEIPTWQGFYFFGLFGVPKLFYLDPAGNPVLAVDITSLLGINTGLPDSIPFPPGSFHGYGQDSEGELYVIRVDDSLPPSNNGTIFKIVL